VDWYVIILRVIHIGAGVFWVGAAFVLFLFVQPSAREVGPAGQAFMGHLTTRKKLPLAVLLAGVVTVLAGLLLYWQASDGFDAEWISSGPGISFTVGGIAAIVTLALGLTVTKPAIDRMGALGQEIGSSGGPPTPEQAAELQLLQAKTVLVGRISLVLLAVAVVAMAIARYL
jgi:hypothetical protein